MKYPEMIPNPLKVQKICKHAVKELPLVIRYASDQFKTQKMCHNVIPENTGTSKFLPDYYKNQKLCNKTVDSLSLIDIKLKKYVIKLSIIILLQQNFSRDV